MRFVNKVIFVLILSLIILVSCKTSDPCPKNPAIGNLGSGINTGEDDYLPMVFNDTLFFTSIAEAESKEEMIFKSVISAKGFSPPQIYYDLPYNNFKNISTPIFFINTETGYNELYFAASDINDRKSNRDIYFAINKSGSWENIKKLADGISSDSYESHPVLSKDGKILLFSSDRPGGIGQTDLYLSSRNLTGNWDSPKNLGKQINTPKMEIAPYIDNNGNLWFSSTGYSTKQKMDILRANKDTNNLWTNPKLLPFPINTDGDDTAPCLWNGKLILSSDRREGCGGYDLYSFDICAPVLLQTIIKKENEDIITAGKLKLNTIDNQLIEEQIIDDDGINEFNLSAGNDYILDYENECIPQKENKFFLKTPCSDTSVIKIVLPIAISNHDNFSFSKYNIPFFVTGYYLPNTTENLSALKLKFTYNLLGNHDSTRYIENPNDKYDNIAPIVDKAFNDATSFIKEKINFLKSKCSNGNEKIEIIIKGFTDPRQLSPNSKYAGENIFNEDFNLIINHGDNINNEILSKLRAYYTALLLQQNLQMSDEYKDFEDNIIWKIIGTGIDNEENKNFELMRRTDIEINIIK